MINLFPGLKVCDYKQSSASSHRVSFYLILQSVYYFHMRREQGSIDTYWTWRVFGKSGKSM